MSAAGYGTMLVRLDGQITADGQLVLELPDGLPAGDVKVTLEIAPEADDLLTDAEIDALLSVKPAENGAEAVARLDAMDTSEWVHIDDPVAWVEEVKRRAWHSA